MKLKLSSAGVFVLLSATGCVCYCNGGTTIINATEFWQNLESPGFLNGGYDDDLDCEWTLHAPVRHGRIVIEVLDSDINGAVGHSCPSDYVRVTEQTRATSTKLGEWCGQILPRYHASTRSLLVSFHTDSSGTGRGFRLQYRYVRDEPLNYGCNSIISLSSYRKFIYSPNYPASYPDDINCWWIVKGPEQHKIYLQSEDFQMEKGLSCSDYLSIYDDERGELLIRRFCGLSSIQVNTSSNEAFLLMKTDNSVSAKGFNISLTAIDDPLPSGVAETVSGCPSDKTPLKVISRPRYLLSPNYPRNYDGNTDCIWVMEAANASLVVRVQAVVSNIEDSTMCSWDFAQVYDGPGVQSPILGRWCGSEKPKYQSTGRYMTLRFHSDGSTQFSGFNLSFFQVDASDKLPTSSQNAIVGIVLGAVAFFVVVLILCAVAFRWRANRDAADPAALQSPTSTTLTENRAIIGPGGQIFYTTTVIASSGPSLEYLPPSYSAVFQLSPPPYFLNVSGSSHSLRSEGLPAYPATQYVVPQHKTESSEGSLVIEQVPSAPRTEETVSSNPENQTVSFYIADTSDSPEGGNTSPGSTGQGVDNAAFVPEIEEISL